MFNLRLSSEAGLLHQQEFVSRTTSRFVSFSKAKVTVVNANSFALHKTN